MRLPERHLTSTCTVLDGVPSPPGRLGPGELIFTARPAAVKCASFPVSEKLLRRAELLGVSVSREVYMKQIDLSPQTNRLRVDGKLYAITDVQEWDGFTVAGVVSAS